MARIEKTVFISYRRADVYTALAVYENLKNQGYDVFFDYRSISSGDFEQIITSNIRARAHFLIILTPTALDRLNEPGDWLRREIENAIDEKRNIIPLFFKGFRFGHQSVSDTLTGKLKTLSRYNGLNVHEDYFEEAMVRLRTEYLNRPLDTVLHPVSTEVRKVVREEQNAADKALEQIDDVKVLVKQTDDKPVQLAQPDPMPKLGIEPAGSFPEKPIEISREKVPPLKPSLEDAKSVKETTQNRPKPKSSVPHLNFRLVAWIAAGLVLLGISLWGISSLLVNPPVATVEPSNSSEVLATQTSQIAPTNTPSPTQTTISPSEEPGIGSTMTGKDGMTLLYVPASEFTMGSEDGGENEKPVHTVFLDAYWIDQTEVTTSMYARCVQEKFCNPPSLTTSFTRDSYYGDSEFGDYPVIYVSWEDAQSYCSWANRRLPTEAEWEKAARGINAFTYPWGESTPDSILLNFYGGDVGDTSKVGSYPKGASPFGALDMAGNVAEWVADRYRDFYYADSPNANPQGPEIGEGRVVRGGAWEDATLRCGNFFSTGYECVNAPSIQNYATWKRDYDGPRVTKQYYGFRCAMSATP